MSFTGYRVYRGRGGLGAVDWSTPVATAPAEATTVQLVGLGHIPGATYTYALRPVLADLETADVSCAVGASFDGVGEWMGDRPGGVRALSAAVEAAGTIRVRWRIAADGVRADEYAVYTGPSARVDTSGAALSVITDDGGDDYATTLTYADGDTVYIAVVARTTAGATAPTITIGPLVADVAAPPAPVAYADAAF